MHVTEGTAPQNVDKEVRFRTTYFFRVFDYCWSTNATVNGAKYRDIVPESDTLYRYRMTGKASALFSKIKFESGVLDESAISPFGTDVTYNGDINGFIVRDREQARAEADKAAADRGSAADRAGALDRYQALAELLTAQDQRIAAADGPAKASASAGRDQLVTAMTDALASYTGTLHAPPDQALAAQIKQDEARIKALEDKVAPPGNADLEKLRTELTSQINALKDNIAKLATVTPTNECPVGEVKRKGFQIMGPEGMRPFDQSKRLIMAMTTSAKPLIETLDEYSGRMLNGRQNPAVQLLPLARETTLIVEAERALDGVAAHAIVGVAPPPPGDAFDAAIAAFSPNVHP